MNKLSKIIISAVTLVFFAFLTSSLLQAQPRQERRGPMLPDSTQIVKMVNELTKVVSLSEQQKEEVLKIHFEHFNHEKTMMEKDQKNHKEMRKAHDESRGKFEKQIKTLLNEKQQAEFEKFMKRQHKERRRPR